MEISGKNAVLIGGAQGIGHAYCQVLLQKGAKLYMGDVQEEKGQQAVREFQKEFGSDRAHFCKVDVTKEADIKEIFRLAVERFGRIDITVGNAGIINEFEWMKCVDINLMGTIRVTMEALKHMGKDQGGSGGVIVHTASISGLRPEYWGPVYSATKWGVVGFCKSMALEKNLEKSGVRVNCICPTGVKTGLMGSIKNTEFEADLEKFVETMDFLPFSELQAALVELIETGSHNGSAMTVTRAWGRKVADFPEYPLQ